jgi:hypothetical protein
VSSEEFYDKGIPRLVTQGAHVAVLAVTLYVRDKLSMATALYRISTEPPFMMDLWKTINTY